MVLTKGRMSARAFRAGRISASRPKEVVQRKSVFLARHDQEEQKESQAGNDVLVERVQRLFQEVAERDDDEHDSQGQQRPANVPAGEKESTREELDERNGETDSPERPVWQEGVLIGQKPPADMTGGGEAEDFVDPGHEEDESEN